MTDSAKAKNSFSLAEPAVRGAADRIAGQSRRARREINGTVRHLHIDAAIQAELEQQGHLYWANDDLRGGITELENIGYRHVLNQEAFGDREGLDLGGKVKVRYGTADNAGTPQDIYLMIQPWEFYKEDMEALEAANAQVDANITRGDGDVSRGFGRNVTLS